MVVDTPFPASTPTRFPNGGQGLLLYFDPTSDRARILSEELLEFASTSTPFITTTLSEATHIVLNPFSTFGQDFLQAQPSLPPLPSSRPPFILAFRWIEESIRFEQWQPEGIYLYIPRVEEVKEEELSIQSEGIVVDEVELNVASGEPSELVAEAEDEADVEMGDAEELELRDGEAEEDLSGGDIALGEEEEDELDSDQEVDELDDEDDDPDPAGLLALEDENLAGFLASFDSDVDPFTKGYDGLDSFDHFVDNSTTSTRTAEECRSEYRKRDFYFLPMITLLREEPEGASSDKAELLSSRRVESGVTELRTEESRKDSSVGAAKNRFSHRWTPPEAEEFAVCLRESFSLPEAVKQFVNSHPTRSKVAVNVYYSKNKAVHVLDVTQHGSLQALTTKQTEDLARIFAFEESRSINGAIKILSLKHPNLPFERVKHCYASNREHFHELVRQLRTAKLVASGQAVPKSLPPWTDSLVTELLRHVHAHGGYTEAAFASFITRHPERTIGQIRWWYQRDPSRFNATLLAMTTDPSASFCSSSLNLSSLPSSSSSSSSSSTQPFRHQLAHPSWLNRPRTVEIPSKNQASSVASGSYSRPPPPLLSTTFPPSQLPSALPPRPPNFPSLPPPLPSLAPPVSSLSRFAQPPSFLQVGVAPSFSPHRYCWFCGMAGGSVKFLKKIELAEPARMVCNECLVSLGTTVARDGGGADLARMGGEEKLEWVVGVLKMNGAAKRRLVVRVKDWGIGEERVGGMRLGNSLDEGR